jgi:hypothetical protein
MAHGTPLATGDGYDECGAAGPFLLDVGISSSYHIAKFFGIVPADRNFASKTQRRQPTRSMSLITFPAMPGAEKADRSAMSKGRDPASPRGAGLDVGAAIARALRAAGLMKDG